MITFMCPFLKEPELLNAKHFNLEGLYSAAVLHQNVHIKER